MNEATKSKILKDYLAQFEWRDVGEDWFVIHGFKDTWGYINLYSLDHAWIYTSGEMMATAGFDTARWNIGTEVHFEPPLRLQVQVNQRGARVVSVRIQLPVYEQMQLFV